jgi:hypothetical protein
MSVSNRTRTGSFIRPVSDQDAQNWISSNQQEINDDAQSAQWRPLVKDFALTFHVPVNVAAHLLSPAYEQAKADLGISGRSRSRSRSGSPNGSYGNKHNPWIDTLRDEIPRLKEAFPDINAIEAAHALHLYYSPGGRTGSGAFNYDAFEADLNAAKAGQQNQLTQAVQQGVSYMPGQTAGVRRTGGLTSPTGGYQTRSRSRSGVGAARPQSPSSPSAYVSRNRGSPSAYGGPSYGGSSYGGSSYGGSYNRFGY